MKKRLWKTTRFFLLLLLAFQMATPVSGQVIRGSNGTATPMKTFDITVKRQSKVLQSTVFNATKVKFESSANEYFALKFNRVLTLQDEELLKTSGIALFGYLNDQIYIVRANNTDKNLQSLAKLLESGSTLTIDAISDIPAPFKLKSTLLDYLKNGADVPLSVVPDGVAVSVFDATDLPALERTLTNWGVTFRRNNDVMNGVIADTQLAEKLLQIANIPYVSALEEYTAPKPEDFGMTWMMQPNQIAAVNYGMNGPIGRGAYFANWETYGKADYYKLSTYGRNIPGKTDNTDNGHGTSCALIVGGSGNADEYENFGMAPGIKILGMNDVISPGFMSGVAPAISAGYSPLVANHSVGWSNGIARYNQQAVDLDKATYENPTFIQCYSAGNSAGGGTVYPPHIFPDYGNLTGDIKTNKNNFTVHSSALVAEDVSFACFGPTADGRLKPDICAEGTGGTSYASPGVAGMAGVLYEVYNDTYTETGRSDVVKAVMLNTAIDMLTKGIDFMTGFGQINPRRAVNSLRNKNLIKDQTIAQGNHDVFEHQITIPEGMVDARILLYWHDYPGVAGTARALVNDLDLEVVTPSGQTILPWVLDATPARVKDLPLQKRDSLNNVEQVTFDAPEAGTYILRVRGKSVVRGPQRFVLTWDYTAPHLTITSHPEGFKLRKGVDLLVTWDMASATGINGKAVDVFYRPNAESNWTKLTTTTGKYYARWRYNALPAIFNSTPTTATAQFKIVSGGVESVSGNCQFSATPTNLRITEFCPEKATLAWNALPASFSGEYIIYALGSQYMEEIARVDKNTTSYTINAKAGEPFTAQNAIFAIGAYHDVTKATSLRSAPVGIDILNTATAGSSYGKTNTICYGDVINLTTTLEGNVKWYKNGELFDHTGKTLPITTDNLGRYAYEVEKDGCSWRSEEITVTTTSNIADTTQVGNFTWKAYVFKGGNENSAAPLFGAQNSYYGKYDFQLLSFNSSDDIVSWDKPQQNISGYVGCPFPDRWNTTLMKRKGFVEGTYNIVLTRASRKMRITVTDANGAVRTYTSTSNFSGTVTAISNVKLNSNSEVRIEWYGDHLVINFNRTGAAPEIKTAPGNVKTGLAAWITPATASTDDKGLVTDVRNGVPQNVVIVPDRPGANISVRKSGLNFNPTFVFKANGGLKGVLDGTYQGNAAADFVTFRLDNPQPQSWARVLSVGNSAAVDRDNTNSYVAVERIGSNSGIGTMRKGVQVEATGAYIGAWHAMMVQYNAANVKILNKGKTLAGASGTSNNFSLNQYTIGSSFKADEAVTMSGQVAEVIHYNRAMTADEENKINSYLALKYGLTLQGNYVNASGNTVFPADAVFKYGIAGLSCDSTQMLVQKQSKSEETPFDVLVGSLGAIAASNEENTTAFAKDNTFMIWAHNNKTVVLGSATNSPSRIWKLVATGNKEPFLRINLKKGVIMKTTNEALKMHIITSDAPNLNSEKTYLTEEYTGGDGVEYYFADIPVDADVKYVSFGYRLPTGLNSKTYNADTYVTYNELNRQIKITTLSETYRMEVISITGTVLKSINSKDKTTYIPAKDLPQGVYVVRVLFTDNTSSSHKLIIN